MFCSESFAAGQISGRLMFVQTAAVSHKPNNSGESHISNSRTNVEQTCVVCFHEQVNTVLSYKLWPVGSFRCCKHFGALLSFLHLRRTSHTGYTRIGQFC